MNSVNVCYINVYFKFGVKGFIWIFIVIFQILLIVSK